MKRKMFYFVSVLIVCAVAAMNVNLALDSKRSGDLTMASIEALGSEFDDIGGSELPEVEITCGQHSGKCNAPRTEYIDYGKCRAYCAFTGVQADYCNAIWMGIVDFCINFMI